MRYWVFTWIGLLIGAPLGVLVTLTLQRFRKNRCVATDGTNRCNGNIAKVCIDGLCPTHCRVLHQDQCRTRYLANNGATQ